MEWLRDWRELTARGSLATGSRLPEMLGQRMQWRAIEELAHRSDRGRTLSRVGIAVLFPALADLTALSRTLTPELRQAGGGLEALTEEGVLFWATGTVLMLIQAGAIFHLGRSRSPRRVISIGSSSPSRAATGYPIVAAPRHRASSAGRRAGTDFCTWRSATAIRCSAGRSSPWAYRCAPPASSPWPTRNC